MLSAERIAGVASQVVRRVMYHAECSSVGGAGRNEGAGWGERGGRQGRRVAAHRRVAMVTVAVLTIVQLASLCSANDLVRVAREPAVVPLEVGTPERLLALTDSERSDVASAAAMRIVYEAEERADRWIVLWVKGLPLRYDQSSADVMERIASAGGPSDAEAYERWVAEFLADVLDGINGQRPGLAISVMGLPVEPTQENAGAAEEVNANFKPALDRLDAFASSHMFIRMRNGQPEMPVAAEVSSRLPEAFRLRAGRPILFRMGNRWAIVTQEVGMIYFDAAEAEEQTSEEDPVDHTEMDPPDEPFVGEPQSAQDPFAISGGAGQSRAVGEESTTAVEEVGAGGSIGFHSGGGGRRPFGSSGGGGGGGVSVGGGGGGGGGPTAGSNGSSGTDDDSGSSGTGVSGGSSSGSSSGTGTGHQQVDPIIDCNENGIADDEDIASGTSEDCDGDGVPDECETLLDSDGDGVPDCADDCPMDPEKTEPGDCGCGTTDIDTDGDGVSDCIDGCPDDPAKTEPGDCGCGVVDIDSDGDGTSDCIDGCPDDPEKTEPSDCGCGFPDSPDCGDCNGNGIPDDEDIASGTSEDCDGNGVPDECQQDADGDGLIDACDACPADPDKIEPGDCGCGVADTDSDGDGVVDCLDGCPDDPGKTDPGSCGCGVADTDSDGDGWPDCVDDCPDDPDKVAPGDCGCGVDDVDSDGDGAADCIDGCPDDPNKTEPGTCGCGVADTDSDGDGWADCIDGCPDDPGKTEPGTCGCGVADVDSDGDGVLDCEDGCPDDPDKTEPGDCGCGTPDIDSDGDGVLDCDDGCPFDPDKIAPGVCGCGVPDIDSDGDGVPDCDDGCPDDPNKTSPGQCGCGVADTDSDGDGTADCIDGCPGDPGKTDPGACGCGVPDTDTDGDAWPDCVDDCPDDPGKIEPGVCGCGVADADSDGDGVLDCVDGCPNDPDKVEPGQCGCGVPDTPDCGTDDGWTVFTPSMDTRLIYLSSSQGDDATAAYYSPSDPEIGDDPFNPVGPIKPYATLAAAAPVCRQGYPDWVLCKRGDVWTGSWPWWNEFGRAEDEPHLLSAYGSGPRPKFIVPEYPAIQIGGPKPHIAIVSIELQGLEDGTGYSAIRLLASGENYLIEDCKISRFTNGLNISLGEKTNVRLRRNVVTNCFYAGGGAHSQGAFINNIDGLLLEENIFHQNGHKGDRSDANIFNHNLYLENGLSNVQIRGNIISDASSNGISLNGAGLIENNLVVRNPVGIFARTAPTTVLRNVVLEGNDITTSLPRGWGIVIGDAYYNPGGPAIVEQNIIAHKIALGDLHAIFLDKLKHDVPPLSATIFANTVYDWNGTSLQIDSTTNEDYESIEVLNNIFDESPHTSYLVWYKPASYDPTRFTFSANQYVSASGAGTWLRVGSSSLSLPQWMATSGEADASEWTGTFTDPDRTLGTYHATLGKEATFEGFIEEALKQSKTNWRAAYTAGEINKYFREGFDMDP